MTDDGRPFARDQEPDEELALWIPDPPRDGDPVYCCGICVGTFRGDRGEPGGWYLEMVATKDMPPKLASWTAAKLRP